MIMSKRAYHGGAFFNAVGDDFSSLERSENVINADVLDAWFPPTPKALEKIRAYLPYIARTSPPTYCEGLMRTISEKRGIPIENIVVGGGSSDLMFTFFPLVLTKNSTVLILDPMYGEYQHIFEHIVEVNLVRHTLTPAESFKVNREKLLQSVKTHQPDMVVIVNPNSPTGQYWEREDVLHFLEAIPSKTTLVIDETYIEYVDSQKSMERDVLHHQNLVVIKSMSKVYAISGARVGYLVASPERVEEVAMVTPPWSVSLFGQIAAVEALNDWKYYEQRIAETHDLRRAMIEDLRSIPAIEVFESVGNYFLIHLKKHKASHIIDKLMKENIFVRNCNSMSNTFNDDYIRIAVKDAKSNQKIIDSMKKILA